VTTITGATGVPPRSNLNPPAAKSSATLAPSTQGAAAGSHPARRIAARRADPVAYGTALGKPDLDDLAALAAADRDGAFMLAIARRHRARARII